MLRKANPPYAPAFKAQVALAAVRGEEPLPDLVQRFGVPASSILAWQHQLTAGASALFATDGASAAINGNGSGPSAHETPDPQQSPADVERTLFVYESFMRQVLDNLFVYVGVLDPSGKLIQVSRNALADAGLRPEDVLGKHFWDCHWWNHSDLRREAVRQGCLKAAQGESLHEDTVVRMGDREITVDFQLTPLRDGSGRITHLVASGVDVTARKAQQEELRQRAEEVEKLMDLVPAAVFFAHDERCLTVTGNRMATELYQAEPGENLAVGASGQRRFYRDGRPVEHQEMPMSVAARTGRELRDQEFEVALPSGRRINLWGSVTPLRDAKGRVRGCIGAYLETTERRKAEQALEESEQRFRALAELAPDATLVHSDGRLVYANPAALRLMGARVEADLLGTSVFDRIDPAFREQARTRARQVSAGERVPAQEQVWLAIDGTPLDVEVASGLTEWHGQPAVQLLLRDLSARREAETALRESERRLREADRRKDEFLAMLAHELRNPLAPVRTAVKLLEDACAELPDCRPFIDVLDRQSANLSALVDDLLDVSRITRGLVELSEERISLGAVVDHALESVLGLLDGKGHDVNVILPREPVEVIGDPVRLEQILVNLLTNAAKYTDPGGRIDVVVQQRDHQAEVRVRDTGIGMSKEALGQIFTLFEQADRAIDRSQGGLGIGLTITRRLVEMHGGTIVATSEGPGRGAAFVVNLPLAPAAAAPEAPPGVTATDPARMAQRRVLVVDDNRDAADTLVLLLQSMGHTVSVAYDGPEALDRAGQEQPELILLDIGLPGIDGYEVARRLREDPRTAHTRIAALTGYGQPSDRRRSESVRIDRHFVKPVELASLREFLAG